MGGLEQGHFDDFHQDEHVAKVEDANLIVDKNSGMDVVKTDSEYIENQDIDTYNKDQELAENRANEIVDGLPDTLDQLSPEQQKQFVDLVQHDISGTNLNLAPKNVESVPDLIPPYWKQQVDAYKEMRSNISRLPSDKQEALRRAEKEAISKITEDSKGALESGGVTMPGESEPDSTPNSEPDSTMPDGGNEGNSGSQGGGREF